MYQHMQKEFDLPIRVKASHIGGCQSSDSLLALFLLPLIVASLSSFQL